MSALPGKASCRKPASRRMALGAAGPPGSAAVFCRRAWKRSVSAAPAVRDKGADAGGKFLRAAAAFCRAAWQGAKNLPPRTFDGSAATAVLRRCFLAFRQKNRRLDALRAGPTSSYACPAGTPGGQRKAAQLLLLARSAAGAQKKSVLSGRLTAAGPRRCLLLFCPHSTCRPS